nr:hypothetical protein [Bifidobacterium bifidum]
AMILANDAERGSQKELLGDPTETALWQFYIDKGLDIDEFRQRYPRLNSWPFDSERKLMSVAVNDKQPTLYLKGAVDELLTRADRILD